ncbi:DNA excision repair protein ERCC-1 [Bienertia sinuspersici]
MEEENPQNEKKKSSIIIQIPSYQQVLEGNQPKSTPPSLFTPSQTFTQAFASIKNSEFYIPPPPPTSSSNSHSVSSNSSLNATSSSSALPSSSRQTGISTNSVQKSNAIFVSHRQKGNPLLKHIRNVKWNFAEVIPDYVLGQNTCALYLSLRYHLLHPDYLYYRIRELQKNFRLRVVLCHVDVEDVVKPLLEVTRTCLLHDCTLLCAWSLEECGRYLETIKVYENKPADIIQGHMDSDYLSRLNHALTAVRRVNKTDVVTLGSTFGSLSHIMDASVEDLARCPGIGEHKVKRLYDTFHEPFKRVVPSRPAVPETSSVQNDLIPNSLEIETPAAEKAAEDTSKRQKKDPEVMLKTALSVAFKKYSDKVGKKNHQSEKEDGEGSKSQKESDSDLHS